MGQKKSQSKVNCPHCGQELAEEQLRSLWGAFMRGRPTNQTGNSRFSSMTAEERKAAASAAATARWKNKPSE
jgi:hypothetical protein